MLKKKFQLVGGSEGSGELKNKLLNKCWKKTSVVLKVKRYNMALITNEIQ